MYAEFAKVAYEEGFTAIAKQFEGVAKIEKEHEERYRKLAENVETAQVFAKAGITVWVCRNCGHVHVAETAPKACPVCFHAQSYFEVKANNF